MSKCGLRGLIGVLFTCALGLAVAQTVLSIALDDLARYYRAAAVLMAKAVTGVNQIEPVKVPKADRNKVKDELNRISRTISLLRAAQAPLVFDLSEYVERVRSGQLEGERRLGAWRSILSSVSNVSGIVITTLEVVESSAWLKVTLDAEHRLALREVLLSRSSVLQKLSSLPAPGTDSEIDQLDRMNKFYRQLMKSLSELNVALTRATERIAAE